MILAAGLAAAAVLAVSVLHPLIGVLTHEVADAAGVDIGERPEIPAVGPGADPDSDGPDVGPDADPDGDPESDPDSDGPDADPGSDSSVEPEPEPVDCNAREVLDADIVAVGAQNPDMAAFDQVVLDLLQDGLSPATNASLAVMKDGELVYSRGYAADGTPEVSPDSVFRIASVSKTLTATATMTLVESGAVDLDAPISDYLDIGDAEDDRWSDITVEDLLRHQGGWARDRAGGQDDDGNDISYDPTHRPEEVAEHAGKDVEDLETSDYINYIATLDMQFDPGTEYAYSNVGYLLLGQIIEAASGQDYEDYVQQVVLQPLGIESAAVGSNTQDGSRPNEVTYQVSSGSAYDVQVEQRAAVGGWTMTAEDAARFAHLMTNGGADAVLSPESIETMFSHDEDVETNMTLGWNVHPTSDRIWHDGSLPGTTALTVNRPDGTTWVLLINGRADSDDRRDWTKAIRDALHAATTSVPTWPTDSIVCQEG